MKSEPDVYGFDHLWNSPERRGGWEGVRNYQARNFMKEMRVGDGVLFYHSACAEPGIAGEARVVREAYLDVAQFDPQSPYFDARSPVDAPRWVQVDVAAVRPVKFVSLERLRIEPDLRDLIILRRGNRLSVTPVAESDYRRILTLGEVR